MTTSALPVAVIGAGPVGLAAAAWLHERGLPAVVLEAGDEVGASIRQWGHVRLFSPWRYSIDRAARRLLEAAGWDAPDPYEHPTGHDWVDRYLAPLAAAPAIRDMLHLGARVTAVTRAGVDKVSDAGRARQPFIVRFTDAGGDHRLLARAVIDASGTWRSPNPLGADGVAAAGEAVVGDRIASGIPDVLGAQRERYAGATTAVVGSGHSAQNAIADLAALAEDAPGTRVLWVLRRAEVGSLFGGGGDDQLAARARLGQRARALVASGAVELVTGFRVDAVDEDGGGRLVLRSGDESAGPVDQVIAATGFRPDLGMLRELRLDLDPALESPRTLAPLIDPNVHSCGTVPPHGAAELAHPEAGVYIVGMKSYGRAPTFLALTGFEQVRSVVAEIAGDREAARDVRLELPETGVCSIAPAGAGQPASAADGCCPAPALAASALTAAFAAAGVSPVLDGAGCCGR